MNGTLKGKVCFREKARVLVKVLLRVEKFFYNESTGNGREWTVQMAILVTELLC